MQQRRLRLGDVLDDYCPRERRVTNHVAVAIVEDDVRQTRCTTCDAEHVYRHGKAPAVRRPRAQGALAAEAPDDSRPHLAAPRPIVEAPPPVEAVDVPEEDLAEFPSAQVPEVQPVTAPVLLMAEAATPAPVEAVSETGEAGANDSRDDDGPVHRPLIRATFPRREGHVPERREPEFTVRQPGSRGGREMDGNRAGFRGRGQGQGFGGGRDFGGRPHGGGFGADGHRGGRGPGARGGGRPDGGDPNRGQRPGGGAGRKGGR